jgi:serine/threonine protein kinase
MKETFCDDDYTYQVIVFELMDMNLRTYLTSLTRADEEISLAMLCVSQLLCLRSHPPSALQSFTRQLLQGIHYCHSSGIMHRDLRPHNLFLLNGILKIGNFQYARSFVPPIRPLSPEVLSAPPILPLTSSLGAADRAFALSTS